MKSNGTSSKVQHYTAMAADPSTRLGRMMGVGPRQPEPEGEPKGAPQQDAETSGPGGEGDEADRQTVSRASYVKVLGERKKARAQIADLQNRLEELEGAVAQSDEQRERSQGEWEKLEKRKSDENADLRAKLDAANNRLVQFERSKRADAFADAVARAGDIDNLKVVRKLLPSLDGVEDAPEDFTDLEVEAAVKALKNDAPELFKSKTAQLKPPPGGGQRPPERGTAEYWRHRAEQRNSQQATAYSTARDRQRGK